MFKLEKKQLSEADIKKLQRIDQIARENLANHVGRLTNDLAYKDAIIQQQNEELEELRKEHVILKEQYEELLNSPKKK